MPMLTREELQSIMPRLPAARSAELFPSLTTAMAEFAIEVPARAAAFLAQLAHESGQFRFLEEIWGPTPAQRRYEPAGTLATALGNTETGDGHRFKGRGPIQITGRANYRRFGDLLGVDLVTAPERAASAELAFRIAGLFWSKKGLNELADEATADAFREITRRINGGFNGLAERQQFYAAARAALGVRETPVSRGARTSPPVPRAGEPAFERGHEVIRAVVDRRPRKAAPARRARKTASIKRTRKAASVRRTRKKKPKR
jgi:putative chitinase